MSDRNLGPYIAASVALILASLLLTAWLVLLYGRIEHISDQLDRIDAQMAPEPTPTGRVG